MEVVTFVLPSEFKRVDGKLICIAYGTWYLIPEDSIKILGELTITENTEDNEDDTVQQYPYVSALEDASEISDEYIGAVEYVLQNNIMVGSGNNKFNPKGLVTREQLALVIQRSDEQKKQ